MDSPTDLAPAINYFLSAYWPVLLLGALLIFNILAGDPAGEIWRSTARKLRRH
jgi:hypothetical protein